MSDDKWGVGDQADSKAFGKTYVGDEERGFPVELIHGEHPHSRSDNSIYARCEDGEIYAFSGHRCLKRIVFSDNNRLKESELSGDEIRGGSSCKIFLNGLQVYEFGYRDLNYGLNKAGVIFVELTENAPCYIDACLDGSSGKSLKGRKVWYQNQPAIIDYVMPDQGAMTVIPDPEYLLKFAPLYYLGDMAEMDDEDSIKVGVLADGISWYRDQDDGEDGPKFPRRTV